MPLVQRNQVVQTLPVEGADHPLRDRVRLPAGQLHDALADCQATRELLLEMAYWSG